MLEITKKISAEEYDNCSGCSYGEYVCLKPDGKIQILITTWCGLCYEGGSIHKKGWKVLRKLGEARL